MTSPRLAQLTVDCSDPAALAGFWAQVLGWRVLDRAGAGEARLEPPRGDPPSPGWLFLQVPEAKTAKNRMHVDLASSDVERDVARLVGFGARVLHRVQQPSGSWTTLADPEGNEFCLGPDDGDDATALVPAGEAQPAAADDLGDRDPGE